MRVSLALLLILVAGGVARAQGVPTHSNASAAAWREGGRTVGAKITMRLQTQTGGRFPAVRVALVEPGKATGLRTAQAQHGDHPQLFLHQFKPDVPVPVGNPIEHTFLLRYGQDNALKGGMRVAVVSRWPTLENANLLHIWGDSQGHLQEIDLPE